LANILEDKQKNLQSLHTQDEMKNSDLEDLVRRKQEVRLISVLFIFISQSNRFEHALHFKCMDELLMKQRRIKYYDQLKQGKYTILYKQEAQNEQETMKQLDRLRSLSTIVGKLNEEFPNLQPIIRRVESSIQTRLNQEESGETK
jgi:hypothetical protein